MKKSDLKVGMSVLIREGSTLGIIHDIADSKEYDESLRDIYDSRYDIMKVYDKDGNLLWERKNG